jgi:Bacterial alpha-L-rhamnosidase 6 hairpin glycosidase domain
MMLAPALLAVTLMTGEWRAQPATGVEMSIVRAAGRTGDDALKIDFDFKGHGGYAIARRDGAIELPENFELAFQMRADAPRNTLEVKLVQGDNVWWSVRRELDFPREWRRFSFKKRNFEFAWGPGGPGPLPKRIDAVEIVVTAGTGGKGTVLLDDIELTPLDTAPAGTVPRINSLPWTGDRVYELGGLIIDWEKAPPSYEIVTDHATHRVAATNGGRDIIYLPDTDTRRVDIRHTGGVLREVRALPPMQSDNDFFFAVAKEAPRGDYPRYLHREQSYWTVVGGTSGEEAEALISEDGAIEAGNARFSIEPFLRVDGKLVSWNDVAIEARDDRSVLWKKHLSVTPTVENNVLSVRYEMPKNAKLFLAIRPFQVNPPWQFLKRTGGVVKITKIAREPDGIVVEAEETAKIIATPSAFGATRFEDADIIEFLRAGKLPEAQSIEDPQGFASAVMSFDSDDVTISLRLGPPANRQPPTANWKIDVPADPRIEQTLRAQLDYILINRDGPSIQPGSRSYERSWIRDGSLTSAALLRLNQTEVVREFLTWYAKAVAENGYVPCCVSTSGAPDPVPEHDSHGQFIYLVAEYYRHTRDRAVAESMWPAVQRVVQYIDKLRHERMTEQYRGTPFFGMVPESISHEGYSAKPMHSYWDTFFILGGLKDAAFLATELRKPEAARYAALRDEFRRDLLASIAATRAKHGIDYIPGSIELGDFDATSTTVAVSPVDELDALPQEALRRTFERYWEHALEPRTYTPYEWRVVGTLLRLGQPLRALALSNYFFDDQRPAAWRQWSEVVYRNPREGSFVGDMPHTWVGSDFIRSMLDFFVYEKDGALVLAAGVPDEWLDEGISVENISTHFGPVSFGMRREQDVIVLTMKSKPNAKLIVPPGVLIR